MGRAGAMGVRTGERGGDERWERVFAGQMAVGRVRLTPP